MAHPIPSSRLNREISDSEAAAANGYSVYPYRYLSAASPKTNSSIEPSVENSEKNSAVFPALPFSVRTYGSSAAKIR